MSTSKDVQLGSPDTAEAEAAARSPPPNNNDDDDNDNAQQRIEFRDFTTVDRLLPTLLSDSGKMTLETWEDFCDNIDEALRPLARSDSIRIFCVLAVLVLVLVGCAIGGLFSNKVRNVVYGLTLPAIFVSLVIAALVEKRACDKASNTIANNICAPISNRDPDLVLKLYSETANVKKWFIGVTVRNVRSDVVVAAPIIATAFPVVNGGEAAPAGEAPV